MKLIETPKIALRSAFVAPNFDGAVAGVCPQSAFRRTTTGMGPRPWSPLIT